MWELSWTSAAADPSLPPALGAAVVPEVPPSWLEASIAVFLTVNSDVAPRTTVPADWSPAAGVGAALASGATLVAGAAAMSVAAGGAKSTIQGQCYYTQAYTYTEDLSNIPTHKNKLNVSFIMSVC